MRKLIILYLAVTSLISTGGKSAVDNLENSPRSTEIRFQESAIRANKSQVESAETKQEVSYELLMAEAIINGDYNQAKYYESLVTQENLTFENLLWLAKIIHVEAGSDWLTEEHRQLVASVLINRVNSPEFPKTVYEVIHQKGQYALAGTKYLNDLIPSRKSVLSALEILVNGSVAPRDVVFQSTFKQGGGVYKSIYDSTLKTTTYFCYSSNRNLYK